jgi:uncharacterized C2H2 Zn-finger protein
MQPCPKCGVISERAVWPYLKGTDASGELNWYRCPHCKALWSNLTPVEVQHVERQDHQPDRR